MKTFNISAEEVEAMSESLKPLVEALSQGHIVQINPKQKKIINLYVMIDTDIDMEFSDNDTWYIGKLEDIAVNSYFRLNGINYDNCRIRQNHWHSWHGSECPLPEGLIISYSTFSGARRWINNCTDYTGLNWNNIYEFKITGKADGWNYKWEMNNKT